MAENSGGNGGLYFIVGGLVVVVVIIIMVLSGNLPFGTGGSSGGKSVDIRIEAPKLPAVGSGSSTPAPAPAGR